MNAFHKCLKDISISQQILDWCMPYNVVLKCLFMYHCVCLDNICTFLFLICISAYHIGVPPIN